MAGYARRGPLWPAALVAGALLAGAAAHSSPIEPGEATPPAAGAQSDPRPAGDPLIRPPLAGLAGAAEQPAAPGARLPERLRIPAIDVDAPLVPLGLEDDGAMEIPDDAAVAGWYAPGPVPGDPGPAVLAGHVDSRTGPAVFFRLRDLRPGDVVEVFDRRGRAVRFAVRRVERHPKDELPVERIWNPTPAPALRLVTCGGTFDRSRRSYTHNVIVWADPLD